MRKFKFKLQTPLKVRQLIEQTNKQKLSQAIALKKREEQDLNKLQEADLMVRAQLDSHLADFINSADLTFFHEYLTDLGFRIKRQREKVQEAEKLYELARLAFIASRKERKVLERVKEKKFELYLIDANREEQKISDEMAILNACRKEGEFE